MDEYEKGFGPIIITEFVRILSKNPDVKEVIVDPAPTNIRAIRAYEKAGFIYSGVIETLDGSAVLMKFSIL